VCQPNKRRLNRRSPGGGLAPSVVVRTAPAERYLDMSSEPNEALEVLRGVWNAQAQDSDSLADDCGPAKSCKRMSDINFDGMAGADGDLRAAWKDRLKREGKLSEGTGSVADLVLGSAKVR
jgi:hypothetical protein